MPETPLQIFLRFLRFGLLAWGGPVAQIAMIKRELVEEQRWLEPSRFNRLLAIYQVLPGPEAHELCVHFGVMKGRRLGGLLAGLGFMLPGLILILAIAWLYQRLDLQQPQIAAVFIGIQIGVIALIVRAVHRIADHTLSDAWLWAIAIASAACAALGVSFWVTLPAAGLAYAALAARRYAIAVLVVAAAVALGSVDRRQSDFGRIADARRAAVCAGRSRQRRRAGLVPVRAEGGPADLRRRLHRHPLRPRRCGRARVGQRQPVPRQSRSVRRDPRPVDHLRHLRRLSSPEAWPAPWR